MNNSIFTLLCKMSETKMKLVSQGFEKNKKRILFLNKQQALILKWLGLMPELTVKEFMQQYKKTPERKWHG